MARTYRASESRTTWRATGPAVEARALAYETGRLGRAHTGLTSGIRFANPIVRHTSGMLAGLKWSLARGWGLACMRPSAPAARPYVARRPICTPLAG